MGGRWWSCRSTINHQLREAPPFSEDDFCDCAESRCGGTIAFRCDRAKQPGGGVAGSFSS